MLRNDSSKASHIRERRSFRVRRWTPHLRERWNYLRWALKMLVQLVLWKRLVLRAQIQNLDQVLSDGKC